MKTAIRLQHPSVSAMLTEYSETEWVSECDQQYMDSLLVLPSSDHTFFLLVHLTCWVLVAALPELGTALSYWSLNRGLTHIWLTIPWTLSDIRWSVNISPRMGFQSLIKRDQDPCLLTPANRGSAPAVNQPVSTTCTRSKSNYDGAYVITTRRSI